VERADVESLAATLDLDDTTAGAVVPALSAWRKGTVPLLEYPAGSTGPEDSLLPDD